MAVQFEFYKNPVQGEEEGETSYHPRVVNFQHVTTQRLAVEIHSATTFGKAEVEAMLMELSRCMGNHLREGQRVHLDGVGYFQITLQATEPIHSMAAHADKVKFKSVSFLADKDLKSELVKSVFDLEIDPEITSVIFKEEVWQTNHHNEKLNGFQKESNYLPEIVDFSLLDDFGGIKFFFTHDSHQTLVDLKDRILEHHSDHFNHAFSLPFCLEFMHKSVDKSVAIAKILEKENFVFEQTISFGDGYNDENMLTSSSKGLVMGNAPDSLKAKLSHLEVISTNDNEGVANYIVQKLLNN